MTNKDRILKFLRENIYAWCDDCISKHTEIEPRQTVNRICRELYDARRIHREYDRCTGCSSDKLVNFIKDNELVPEKPQEPKPEPEPKTKPWYWEGNVQSALISYLAKEGYRILSVADTESRVQGIDIKARTPEGKNLWISVKGYPENSPHTQARHWFAHAIFDIILYRNESQDVDLALAFPDGFSTYLNLSQRIRWFKNTVPFKIFWILEDKSVRIE